MCAGRCLRAVHARAAWLLNVTACTENRCGLYIDDQAVREVGTPSPRLPGVTILVAILTRGDGPGVHVGMFSISRPSHTTNL